MGKGNRSRQDRAFQTVQNVEEVTPKSTKIKTAIATAAVAVLIVGCILLSVIVNTGIVLRTKNVAKTDNFSVSGTVMSYLVYSQAQSYAYYYQQMGMTNVTMSDIINQFGVKNSVLSQVKEMLVLCEYAKANGITLSEDDKADIDAYIDSIKEAAAQELYSTNAYVKLMYGNGVNINDIREALEITYLSQAALEKIQANLEGQITDELMLKQGLSP
jgi:FKBP-type peptidyl-prolyl cis-trans isomerase (trigger factor)